jgi:CBS domain-containing protein
MVNVQNLLQTKGNEVWSVEPQTSVLETLKQLRDKDVGALLVCEGDQLVGIISERDIVQQFSDLGDCAMGEPVHKFMTKEVFTVSPDQTIEDCMQLMTNKRIRHIPVVNDKKLLGVISIGDVVKAIISNREWMIQMLENYIEGRGYSSS